MMGKLFQLAILVAVGISAFFALYLLNPPAPLPDAHLQENAPVWEATFSVPVDPKFSVQVGILGESWSRQNGQEAYNSPILIQLFDAFKAQQAKAIFFTGNLIDVASKEDEARTRQSVAQFSEFYRHNLGNDLPFFPVIGDKEGKNPGIAKIFREAFSIGQATILGNELLYSVSIGPAFFAVIPTRKIAEDGQTADNSAMFSWLNAQLKEAAKRHTYLFVIGHEPAFPSTSTFSARNRAERNAFWRILVDNDVLAYFAGNERLFDRSNRYGVWQIVSGGGGAPLALKGGKSPFFHALLLTFPAEGRGEPTVKVLDLTGKVVEEFRLLVDQEPVYQMRIS